MLFALEERPFLKHAATTENKMFQLGSNQSLVICWHFLAFICAKEVYALRIFYSSREIFAFSFPVWI